MYQNMHIENCAHEDLFRKFITVPCEMMQNPYVKRWQILCPNTQRRYGVDDGGSRHQYGTNFF